MDDHLAQWVRSSIIVSRHKGGDYFRSMIDFRLLAACILLTASTLHGQQESQFAHRLDSLRETYPVPGLSALVLRGDSIVYQVGFGFADLEDFTPATPQTNYRIASLTKPIAATLLLQLVERGELSLQDSMKAIVPGYEEYYQRAAYYIRKNAPEYAGLVENFDYTRDDITVWHHLTHTAQYVPGDTFSYNGFLYGGLSRVLEEKWQTPFAELLQKNILDTLGMEHSAPSQESAPPTVLHLLAKPYGYAADSGRYQLSAYPEPNVNAGAGIVSNVLDLATFDRAIDHHTLIDPTTQQRAWTRQHNNAGEQLPYGLGWFVQEDYDGRQLVWHYGWQPGSFSALYLKLPQQQLTLILLANSDGLAAPFSALGYQRDVLISPFARLFVEAFGE